MDNRYRWRVRRHLCNRIYNRTPNAEEFMLLYIQRLFSKAEQFLCYKFLKRRKIAEAQRVYRYYYDVHHDDNHGFAKAAVRQALRKCRMIRRNKIYNLEPEFICITEDYRRFYYRAAFTAHPPALIPYSDITLRTQMVTSNRFFVGEPLPCDGRELNIRLPQQYEESRFLILVRQVQRKIVIRVLYPDEDPHGGYHRKMYRRRRRVEEEEVEEEAEEEEEEEEVVEEETEEEAEEEEEEEEGGDDHYDDYDDYE